MKKRKFTPLKQKQHPIFAPAYSRFKTKKLLHRIIAHPILDEEKSITDLARKINLLGFGTLLVNHHFGIKTLPNQLQLIPTRLVLGSGASSILRIGLLIGPNKDGEIDCRRVAIRTPHFERKGRCSYRPGDFANNEKQKALYDHENIEPPALFHGTYFNENVGKELEVTIEEVLVPAIKFIADEVSEKSAHHLVTITLGMAKAIEYLHSYNLIHRDIKPWNALVHFENDKLDVFLSDLESIRPQTDRKIHMRGTPRFVAPEVMESLEESKGSTLAIQTFESDMYALGQSIMMMRFPLLLTLLRQTPHQKDRLKDMLDLKMETSVKGKLPDPASFDRIMATIRENNGFQYVLDSDKILTRLEEITRELIDENPKKRPTATHIVSELTRLQAELNK